MSMNRRLGSGLLLAGAAVVATASASHATVFVYVNSMSGPLESPVNNSPASGLGTITYNDVARTLRVQATFSGLLGNTTACHIHATTPAPDFSTAGVATQLPSFVGFPLGVTSGVFDNTYDLTLASSWNPAFVTNNGGTPATAEVALASAMASRRAYLNIHTSAFPGGEIRGFIPAPGAAALLGLAGLAAARRRR